MEVKSLTGSSVYGILQARILDLPFPPSGDLPVSMLNAECEKGLSEKGIGGGHDALGKH